MWHRPGRRYRAPSRLRPPSPKACREPSCEGRSPDRGTLPDHAARPRRGAVQGLVLRRRIRQRTALRWRPRDPDPTIAQASLRPEPACDATRRSRKGPSCCSRRPMISFRSRTTPRRENAAPSDRSGAALPCCARPPSPMRRHAAGSNPAPCRVPDPQSAERTGSGSIGAFLRASRPPPIAAGHGLALSPAPRRRWARRRGRSECQRKPEPPSKPRTALTGRSRNGFGHVGRAGGTALADHAHLRNLHAA